MKYFGKHSLSSVMSIVLHVLRYCILLSLIISPILGAVIIAVSMPDGMISMSEIGASIPFIDRESFKCSLNYKDAYEWALFSKLPLFVKICMIPYFMAILLFLLRILRKTQRLFSNFKNDIVFNPENVPLVSSISRMLILFSILTVSFSSLLISIILMLFCEIIKNGAALQEDHDLTV